MNPEDFPLVYPTHRVSMNRSWSLLLVVGLAVGLGACGGTETDSQAPLLASGAETPEAAVRSLVEALGAGDFAEVAPLAMPGHAALASLAEGATFGEVAEALQTGDSVVSANFWGGFAQGLGAFLSTDLSMVEGETLEHGDVEYHVVEITPQTGGAREIVTRDLDGYRVDLFASFAPGLAERLVGPVERLLSAQTEDSRFVLSELREVVPSLLLAAERPGQSADVVQSVLRLVELITRVG